MRKIVFSLLLLSFSYSCVSALTNNIENAIDGGSRAIGLTIDTRTGSTSAYKAYQATVTSSVTYAVHTALGRYGSAGFLANDSNAENISIKFSVDGTNYGDKIIVKPGEIISFDSWLLYKNVIVTSNASADYRMVIR